MFFRFITHRSGFFPKATRPEAQAALEQRRHQRIAELRAEQYHGLRRWFTEHPNT